MTTQCDVAVLGAGLAGLCAARDLIGAGLNVAVLEARDRVGGRTLTVPFEAAGLRVDLGAEWVAPAHHVALMEELRSYGIGLEPAPEEGDPIPVLRMTGLRELNLAGNLRLQCPGPSDVPSQLSLNLPDHCKK